MEVVSFLLEHGADINKKNIDGETVDFLKARERNIKYFKFFIEKMDEPDKKNKEGKNIFDILEEEKKAFATNEKEMRKINLMQKIFKRKTKKIKK